jgi:hypothetical protein
MLEKLKERKWDFELGQKLGNQREKKLAELMGQTMDEPREQNWGSSKAKRLGLWKD